MVQETKCGLPIKVPPSPLQHGSFPKAWSSNPNGGTAVHLSRRKMISLVKCLRRGGNQQIRMTWGSWGACIWKENQTKSHSLQGRPDTAVGWAYYHGSAGGGGEGLNMQLQQTGVPYGQGGRTTSRTAMKCLSQLATDCDLCHHDSAHCTSHIHR